MPNQIHDIIIIVKCRGAIYCALSKNHEAEKQSVINKGVINHAPTVGHLFNRTWPDNIFNLHRVTHLHPRADSTPIFLDIKRIDSIESFYAENNEGKGSREK